MQLLESNHAPSEVIFAANLAIEENATNTIKYGDEDDLKHEIAIGLEMTENLLIIEISDDGKRIQSFRSTRSGHLASDQRAQNRRSWRPPRPQNAHACAYDRRDGRNTIRLSKKL